jgi:hypothetical protein
VCFHAPKLISTLISRDIYPSLVSPLKEPLKLEEKYA